MSLRELLLFRLEVSQSLSSNLNDVCKDVMERNKDDGIRLFYVTISERKKRQREKTN